MTRERFEDANAKRFQERVADVAIGISVLRNQGFAGAVDVARNFVASLDLSEFGAAHDECAFIRLLDRKTVELQRLSKERRREKEAANHSAELWGTARKVLTAFRCEAYFHRVLERRHALQNVANWLEIPLDSQLSRAIRREARARGLPGVRFPGVGRLGETTSRQFQEMRIAEEKQLSARIYFEVATWY
ncbi:MAG: hypothetical protein ACLQBA_24435 [Candidatus Binataceae bacterium]